MTLIDELNKLLDEWEKDLSGLHSIIQNNQRKI